MEGGKRGGGEYERRGGGGLLRRPRLVPSDRLADQARLGKGGGGGGGRPPFAARSRKGLSRRSWSRRREGRKSNLNNVIANLDPIRRFGSFCGRWLRWRRRRRRRPRRVEKKKEEGRGEWKSILYTPGRESAWHRERKKIECTNWPVIERIGMLTHHTRPN